MQRTRPAIAGMKLKMTEKQFKREEAPLLTVVRPNGHVKQISFDVALTASEYFPIPQREHEDNPAVGPKLPGKHNAYEEEDGVQYEPSGHVKHVELLVAFNVGLYVPAGHPTQSAPAFGPNVPGGHGGQ